MEILTKDKCCLSVKWGDGGGGEMMENYEREKIGQHSRTGINYTEDFESRELDNYPRFKTQPPLAHQVMNT